MRARMAVNRLLNGIDRDAVFLPPDLVRIQTVGKGCGDRFLLVRSNREVRGDLDKPEGRCGIDITVFGLYGFTGDVVRDDAVVIPLLIDRVGLTFAQEALVMVEPAVGIV